MIKISMLCWFIALTGFMAASTAKEKVISVMNAWKQAMLKRDRVALEKLYAPGLVYIHSSGKRENKSEAIDAVVNGRDRYESIDISDIAVSIYEKTAIVTAKAVLRINNGTTITNLNLDILHVLVKMPSGWQMVARHATRLNLA